MRPSIDIIVETQRSALQRSLAELRLILEEDDDWRALAALLAVEEDAGGIMDHAWSVRHVELIDALDSNPAYCIFNELERTLTALSRFAVLESLEEADVPSPAEHSSTAPAIDDIVPPIVPPAVLSEGLIDDPVDALPAEPPPAVQTTFVRRESIAERIATLAISGSHDVASDISVEQPATADRPPVVPEVEPDLVAEAANRILAAVTSPSADGQVPANLAIDEIPSEEAHTQCADTAPKDVPIEFDNFEAAEPAAEAYPEDEADLAVMGFEEDDPVFEDEDGLEFAEEDFEAEVEIVQGPVASPAAERTDSPPVEQAGADLIEADSIPDDEAETLEERLLRLDRQSESLITPPRKAGRSASSDDDEADKWLEMIRARRAKFARPAAVLLNDTLPTPPAPEATVTDEEDSVVGTIEEEDDFDDGLIINEEAEVRIVQKRAVPYRDIEAADVAVGASEDRRFRPAKDYATELAAPVFGQTEEASVEIVRALPSRPAKAKDESRVPVAEAEPQNRSQRFIRALTGE